MSKADLFSPLVFENGVTAKNRVVLAPMTNGQSHIDGALSDDELCWLAMRAEGGFGIIETCATHVALDGQGWEGELGIFDDRLLPGLTRLASEMRARGAITFPQIFHGGARAPKKVTGARAFSASEIPGDPEEPRAASEEDIARTIAAFRDAAVRAERAGFEGVELHGAHGYLIGQFLSKLNTRSDAYGGDIAGRARFARELVRAVRGATARKFVVGIRLSPEDFGQAKGIDLDETLQVARWLRDDGIDFLHLSLWRARENTQKRPEAHAIPLFREAIGEGARIIACGNIWTREDADAALAQGADAVAIGRAAIANPDWGVRAIDPAWAPKRPPLTPEELAARGLNPTFTGYMRRWKGFVADAPSGA